MFHKNSRYQLLKEITCRLIQVLGSILILSLACRLIDNYYTAKNE